MAGRGFKKVYNLAGGINAWQGLRAIGPMDVGMIFFRGNEIPVEVIILAYGMEEGLASFYRAMASRATDQELRSMFTKLANIEDHHKQRLFQLHRDLDPSVADVEAFETKLVQKVMEGGITTEEFLEQNQPAMETTPDVLNVAMMLEAQSLDLYLRYSDKSGNEKTRTLLYDIAEEEKAHLETLGHLLDKKV